MMEDANGEVENGDDEEAERAGEVEGEGDR
jgi:hypothetical protein